MLFSFALVLLLYVQRKKNFNNFFPNCLMKGLKKRKISAEATANHVRNGLTVAQTIFFSG